MQLSFTSVPSDSNPALALSASPRSSTGAEAASGTTPDSGCGFDSLLAGAGLPAGVETDSTVAPASRPANASEPAATPVVAQPVTTFIPARLGVAPALRSTASAARALLDGAADASPAVDDLALAAEPAEPSSATDEPDDATVVTPPAPHPTASAGADEAQVVAVAMGWMPPPPAAAVVTILPATGAEGAISPATEDTEPPQGEGTTGWSRAVASAAVVAMNSRGLPSRPAATPVPTPAPTGPANLLPNVPADTAQASGELAAGRPTELPAPPANPPAQAVRSPAVDSPSPEAGFSRDVSTPTTPSAMTAVETSDLSTVVNGEQVDANRIDSRRWNAATTRETRSVLAALPRVEKIAADGGAGTLRVARTGKTDVKSFVATSGQELRNERSPIGIVGAQPQATMPSGTLHSDSTLSDSGKVLASAGATEVRVETSSPLPAPVALPSSAHRAVETVLEVTERFSAREQHSVKLQFTVGDADLHVRVEMRAGEVHTTFQTESPELRAALAAEWQQIATTGAQERGVRLATPLFEGGSVPSDSSSFDGSASRQRDPESRPSAETFVFAGSREATDDESATSATTGTTPTRTVSGRSVHLHTLA